MMKSELSLSETMTMNESEIEAAKETIRLIELDLYNLDRNSNYILIELVNVIKFMNEKLRLVDD